MYIGYCEFSLPVKLPGVMCSGQPQIEVTLYEYFCVHVCALVANISAEYFHTLVNYAENILHITMNK